MKFRFALVTARVQRIAAVCLLAAWSSGFPATTLAQEKNNFVYHLFVRSWADARADRDEIGDLRGLREKLDYFNDGRPATDNDLEVGILWLMPIFPSPSYHGYDVTDFRAIHPDYGTLPDFQQLLAAAHQRGMRIMLDIPFNHTSNQHPWFKEAVDNPASRFRKFYQFASVDEPPPPGPWHLATGSHGQQVRYFGLFGSGMPDLNLNEAEVQQEIKTIAQFWLAQGVDGFRLDAAKHVFGDTFEALTEAFILRNNNWWRTFSDAVYQSKPDAVLVGEVLGEREVLRRHAYGLDALLDEPWMRAARANIASPSANFLTSWRQFLRDCRLVNRDAHQGPGLLPRDEAFQPFVYLASHDENPRLASFLEERKRQGMSASVDEAYRVGMYLLTALGKYPILYQGDELMQRGFKWNGGAASADPPGDGSGLYDETLREPFPWHKGGHRPGTNDTQTKWSSRLPKFDGPNDGVSVAEQAARGGMLHLVRGLTNLRTKHPGYANGEWGDILTDAADWWVVEKVSGPDRYLVLINPTNSGRDYEFHPGWFPRYRNAQLLFFSDGQQKRWKDESSANQHIAAKAFVPPYGLVILKQR
jgi:glycosidase